MLSHQLSSQTQRLDYSGFLCYFTSLIFDLPVGFLSRFLKVVVKERILCVKPERGGPPIGKTKRAIQQTSPKWVGPCSGRGI